ncbi:F-BAR domain-containing protein [Balamuthia mandrillaris]
MGKAKKRKGQVRSVPYTTASSGMELQASEEQASSGKPRRGKEPEKKSFLEEAADNPLEEGGDTEGSCTNTKGKILQRHKQEWKQVRKQIEALRQKRLKLNKKSVDKKEGRKQLTKQMKYLEDSMKERHRRELEEFEAQQQTSTPVEQNVTSM